jgi:integrase
LEDSALSSTAPTEVFRTVAPARRPNAELRTREHLTAGEVDALIEAAKAPVRPSGRDHDPGRFPPRAPGGRGLRPEVGPDRLQRRCAARAACQERDAEHYPLLGDELRALRRLQRESPPSPFVFVSERGTPFTTAGFAQMIERAARRGLGLELKAHPHMLRHACGYALANRGHDTRAIQGWLGHRSITSTAVYTALAPNRFKDFWRD